MDKPVLLLPAPAQQRDAAPPTHSLFTLEKADEQGKTPPRLAYPWAWYPPSEFPDLHRLHYEIWMTYHEVQWIFALYAPCSDAERRRKAKAEAKKARLIFLSACVEAFGYYDFLQRFEDFIHDNLMWFGGTAAKHSATAVRAPLGNDALQEDLVTLFKRKDKTAYRRVIAGAMGPYSVDENGYSSIPDLLEQSGAPDPTNTSYLRLMTRALACIVLDAKKRPPTESWVGSKQTGIWKKLLSDRSVLEEVKKIRAAKKARFYEPDIPSIDYEQDDADSDFEDENGQYTALLLHCLRSWMMKSPRTERTRRQTTSRRTSLPRQRNSATRSHHPPSLQPLVILRSQSSHPPSSPSKCSGNFAL
ncbi:hypothetical protein PHMEG_00014928 [Phytophthora megakarya]|uniref:Uncharacterized protein n=1 Tax=Phytophthora megakarya TaxID=4795 RepID=A0A225W2K7_9STRA|nr:hypothetical protein PHMEG_00014928 [Phytophthora megakarya]